MFEKDAPRRGRGRDKRAGARNMCANAIEQKLHIVAGAQK